MAGPADNISLEAKAFSCPNCGGQVALSAPGQSLSAVCKHCTTIIDVTDENYRIIQKAEKARKIRPIIPLGKRGQLQGIEWEAIGFMVRRDTQWGYSWQEYLLYNPWYGYRFLVLSDGHWSLVATVVEEEAVKKGSSAWYEGVSYANHSSSVAQVMYVEGEFYWRVKRHDKANTSDYVRPPYVLSAEWDRSGRTWSHGIYIEPSVVQDAFGLESVPRKVGIGGSQPNNFKRNLRKIGPMAALFIGVVLLIHFFLGGSPEAIYKQKYKQTSKDSVFVSQPFEISGGTGNVEVDLRSDVSNSWLEVYGDLRNTETNVTYSFQMTVEYYYGYTGGENWTEGSKNKTLLINSVPEGTYELVLTSYADIEPLSPKISQGPKSFSIEMIRNVQISSNLILILVILGIYPLFLIFASSSFENRRFAD